MKVYLIGLVWGLCLLAAFVGWGALLNALLVRDRRLAWGAKAAWGVALLITIGGILNLARLVSPAVVIALVGIGVVAMVVDMVRGRGVTPPDDPQSTSPAAPTSPQSSALPTAPASGRTAMRLLTAAAVLLAVVQFAGSASGKLSNDPSSKLFNNLDDFHAYLVYPQKMIQTGSMDPEPFNERRFFSLGGQSFLHAMVLAVGSIENVYIIDPGIGLVITIGLLLGYVRQRGGPPAVGLALVLLLLLLPAPRINTSSILIALALYLAMFEMLESDRMSGPRRLGAAAVLAMITAAAGTLKSSMLPPIGLMFLVSYGVYVFNSRQRLKAIGELALCSVLGLLFVLPWMLAMHRSTGSLLFPLLGRGHHATAYGTMSAASDMTLHKALEVLYITVTSQAFVPALAMAVLALLFTKGYMRGRGAVVAIAVGSLLGSLVMSWAIGGTGNYRYGYSFLVAATLALMARVLTSVRPITIAVAASVLFVSGFFIGSLWDDCRLYYWDFIGNVKFAMQGGNTALDAKRASIRAMQASVPAGEPIVAKLDMPFLMDFSRNPVYVPDWGGLAGPPPGVPVFKGSDALAKYLLEQRIHYVAYSYGDEANFSKKEWGYLLKGKGNRIMVLLAPLAFDFQENLADMAKTHHKVFDDGHVFALDLGAPPDTQQAGAEQP